MFRIRHQYEGGPFFFPVLRTHRPATGVFSAVPPPPVRTACLVALARGDISRRAAAARARNAARAHPARLPPQHGRAGGGKGYSLVRAL